MYSVAIIGCGPMALYALNEMIMAPVRLAITVFERTGSLGIGTPYRHKTNHGDLLANIASIEIPELYESLESWLRGRTSEGLSALGVKEEEINERAFFPRVVVGSYLRDQFVRLCEAAPARGHSITTYTHNDVTDISVDEDGVSVTSLDGSTGAKRFLRFDNLILATGHGIDIAAYAEPLQTFHSSPYPTSRLENAPAARIGILGTSLSAIDALVAIAHRHGMFCNNGSGVRFRPLPTSKSLHFSMMSRAGHLPETDFLVPIPYEALGTFTRQAVLDEIARGVDGLLDRLLKLFKAEIYACDPDYFISVGMADLDAFGIAQAYFAPRTDTDAIEWAKRNLTETTKLNRQGITVRWKYAILRMHEVFETAVGNLSPDDRRTFEATLKKVFIDNYAAVPAASIEKLIALHDLGMLTIRAIGDSYEMAADRPSSPPYEIALGDEHLQFDYFIDATGQSCRDLADLPFPTLASATKSNHDAAKSDMAGVPVISNNAHSVFVAALPFLLADRPFAQGIVTCHEIGSRVGRAVVSEAEQSRTGSEAYEALAGEFEALARKIDISVL